MKITFNRTAAGFILDSFPDLKRKCRICGKKITKANLAGVIHPMGFLCNSIFCIIEHAKEKGSKESEGDNEMTGKSKND